MARQRTTAGGIANRIEAGPPGLTAARSAGWRQELRELFSSLVSEALPQSDSTFR
jgi:hypothetical protein